MTATSNTGLAKNTTHKVVIPFYVYAAWSFLAATLLLLFSTNAFTQHYFHPQTLAITHTMALGWGTMIILGASHQLVPVLIEAKLYSDLLAYCSFILAATGIPLLIYSFLTFHFNWPAQAGAILVNAAIISYMVNLAASISGSKQDSVHAVFVFTAACWLLVTTLIGGTLIFNFTYPVLVNDSLHYLSLHAHIGIAGWFLMMVMGVGSRLVPMFLISKYDNPKRLWLIFFLMNGGLLVFIMLFITGSTASLYLLPIAAVLLSLVLFCKYCYTAYRHRIRKQVDEPVKISLLSVAMTGLPVIFLIILIAVLPAAANTKLILAYGFTVFFGWITAIIFGMTFKTLPFIVWNKIYHNIAGTGKTPNPKDMFSSRIFNRMGICYLGGFLLFVTGIFCGNTVVLQGATIMLLIAAVLYNWNVFKILAHKPMTNAKYNKQ